MICSRNGPVALTVVHSGVSPSVVMHVERSSVGLNAIACCQGPSICTSDSSGGVVIGVIAVGAAGFAAGVCVLPVVVGIVAGAGAGASVVAGFELPPGGVIVVGGCCARPSSRPTSSSGEVRLIPPQISKYITGTDRRSVVTRIFFAIKLV
jgi:hypothetical protein